MEIICTRPSCTRPRNFFGDIHNKAKLRTIQQRYCTNCGMPLFLAERYIPLRLLGRGGFGAAFLACDRYTPTMRPCVVKQFQPSGNFGLKELEIAQSLFEREAIALEKLGNRHPQIPDLYAFFTPIIPTLGDRKRKEQYFYLAQEYIDGQDLAAELEAKGKYSEAEVTEVLSEILKILEFVHSHNSIHRDIKPSNIMRNKEGTLYLLDFGAVKQITQGRANQGRSTGIYSMGFAPPEQMLGGIVYPSTDLYALAATCVNLLTGKPTEQLYDYFNQRWDWHSAAPHVSDRLKAILDKMLLSIPSKRFQSAIEVLQQLHSSPAKNIPPPTNQPTPRSDRPASNLNQPTPTPPPQPASAPIQQQQQPKPPKIVPRPNFSLVEILASAGFAGFEGALLYIAIVSVLSFSGISIGIFGAVLGGLIFALTRRIIEKTDLAIIGGISTAVILFVPILQGSLGIQTILIVATMSAAGAIAITAFFRLVYQLLSLFL